MTSYNSFKDLEKKDAELAHKFKQKDDAVRWCMAIEGPIAKWVKDQKRGEGGRALYELVCYASVRKGIFDEKLPRTKQAAILATFCPDAFCTPENKMSYDPTETAKALQTSMEHCKYINDIKKIHLLPDTHIVRKYLKEIETLIDGQQLPPIPKPRIPTIEERVEAFLQKDVVEQVNGTTYQRIDVQKNFGGGIVPELSVSLYHSKRFLDEDKPSHVEAYEFVHEKLSMNQLHIYNSRYEPYRNIKLYVVSPYSYNRDVIKLAESKHIGLILVNTNEEMTQDSYIVQRSIEDHAQRQLNMEVLTGQRPMNSTLMIFDGEKYRLTTSLADVLISDGIAVVPERIIKAPHLTNDYIEKLADELTRNQVNVLLERIKTLLYSPNRTILGRAASSYISLEVNPAITAQELGIAYEYRKLFSEEQLGYIDIQKETIFLKPPENNYPRDRFTFAHELGHFILHLSCLKRYCYSSVGETNDTINENATITKGELSWFEHHANYFAACYLMPSYLVYTLYIILHKEFVEKKYGDKIDVPLYYNPEQKETFDSYNNVVCRMAMILGVSAQAMTFRLKNMGVLNMPSETDSYKSLIRIDL